MLEFLHYLRRSQHSVYRSIFPLDRFLDRVPGVIHVGANIGQERKLYDQKRLDVIWVEPDPDVFEQLAANIAPFPKQKAYPLLLADKPDLSCTLHRTSNGGQSSSILPLAETRAFWPDIIEIGSLNLTSTTLFDLIERERIDLRVYAALVVDTQGSELLILRGAGQVLSRFHFVKVEVADFEAYKGCCQIAEMHDFMSANGFRLFDSEIIARRPGRRCFEVVYVSRGS